MHRFTRHDTFRTSYFFQIATFSLNLLNEKRLKLSVIFAMLYLDIICSFT